MHPDFVFDSNRCTGCGACRLACSIENGLRPEQSWRQIHTFNSQHHPGAPVFHLSLACNHCHDAACMNACPALAYHRDPATRAVLVDPDKCMGCRYCTWACPYDAPQYDERRGIVTKCTFCVQRLHAGQSPACASLCPTGALSVAAHNPSAAPPAQELPGFPQTELRPSLQLVPLRLQAQVQAVAGALSPRDNAVPAVAVPPSRVNLRSEWSLLAFTFTAAVVVAVSIARALANLAVPAAPFLGAAVIGLALGAAHLGRKERAWRAILNLRRSWLSREIAAYSSFVAISAISLLWLPASRLITLTAALIGIVVLYCIDQVYRPVLLPRAARPHSALALLTGTFLGAVFARSTTLALGLGLLKLVLYVRRKQDALQQVDASGGRRRRMVIVTLCRVVFGFALPALAWHHPSQLARFLAIAGAWLGELIDRTEYYTELGFTTPQRSLALELTRRREHA